VSADGHWQLLSAGYNRGTAVLASGVTTELDLGWHHVELKCQGETIEPLLDSKTLARVADRSHTHGMVALGSDWSHVQFDNFRIAP